MLILPGNPLFDLTLGTSRPLGWQQVAAQHGGDFAFVARAGSGLLEAVPLHECEEYLEGGEYDQRLQEIDEEPSGVEVWLDNFPI